ncbi:hypothetical protein [Streptomyces hokutonensis]|uniref:SAM-dependent methyltransferase n=1 Tax=Streptomyces hokutonensis TaxID=1306990 RepID=A0ABW6M5G2_9ACTN
MTLGKAHGIGDVVISVRPFADYVAQFALSDPMLRGGRVLDCPGGASDFAAAVRNMGGHATSIDPCYGVGTARLTQRITADLTRVLVWTAAQTDRFPIDEHRVWCHAPAWRAAADAFLADFRRDRDENTRHYQPGALPRLPFPDDSFTLAVSGFLLFTYPRQFDVDFHLRALRELLRVAAEVRVHPLNGSAGNPYPMLETVLGRLAADGIRVDLISVPGQSDTRDTQTLRLTRR